MGKGFLANTVSTLFESPPMFTIDSKSYCTMARLKFEDFKLIKMQDSQI